MLSRSTEKDGSIIGMFIIVNIRVLRSYTLRTQLMTCGMKHSYKVLPHLFIVYRKNVALNSSKQFNPYPANVENMVSS